MTKKKQPEPGEFWEYNGVRIYITGRTTKGLLSCEYRDGTMAVFRRGDFWTYLPECDSFEWQPEPVESPDDWVTQDRVPYRYGTDQRRWVSTLDGSVVDNWSGEFKSPTIPQQMHGYVSAGIQERLELRCRRKDLPPMPEETQKREYVRILINQARGSVSIVHGDCDIVLEGCDEVRHDGTGFYLADLK